MNSPTLELIDVSKQYRKGKLGVDGVTLPMSAGLIGLLGPNGAGKSSLMRIIATVTRPTSGRVLFDGGDAVARPNALRRELGYLPQDFGIYPHLNAREFLGYLAAVKGLPAKAARDRIDELLEVLDLTSAGKRRLGQYSGGMLRRVGIAQALLSDPSVLIVDEPTAGLDPEQRMIVRNLLSDLAADRIVLLSTHIVSDIESVASDIAVMADGRIVQRGSHDELLSAAHGLVWELTVPTHALPEFRERHLVSRTVRARDGVRLRLLASTAPAADATPAMPDLEDAYLALIHRRPGSSLDRNWAA